MASTFTETQISAFLSHIGLPPSLVRQRYSGNPSTDYHLLEQLHVHTLSTVPYENLSLHYSPTHKNSIDPQFVYNKIVTNARGRGGYCMENSILYNHILRGLGFPVYMAAVRIRKRVDGVPQGDFGGWVHIVNIVALSNGISYMIDVGFGGDGATAPLPLIDGPTHLNLGTQENRMIRDWIPNQLYRTEQTKLWIYQYRNGPNREWNSFYAFAEVEAMEPDFHNINWYTGSHPESFQTFTQIIVKFLRRSKASRAEATGTTGDIVLADHGSDDQEIYGKRMLVAGVIKENLGGKTAVVETCRTEDERVKALENWFGITLTGEERLGIRGWITELK